MQRHLIRRTLVTSALCLCALSSTAQAGQPDAWVTTKVKIALLTSAGVDGYPVNVDTNDGRVTLYGKVASAEQRREAERVAMQVKGVRNVRDLIQVVPRQHRKWSDANDGRIKTAVNRVLHADPALAGSDIHAKSVNGGVVLLDGKAAALSAHLRALQDASDVTGVRRVESEIDSPDQFGDRDIWYDEPAARTASARGATDSWITTKTKLQFFSDPDINSSDISVDTHAGVITLFGVAATPAMKLHAERVASRVRGARGLRDEIQVVPNSRHDRVTAADTDITAAIKKRLADAELDHAQIHVDVKAGVVRLSGTVPSAMDRYTAMVIARTSDGVRSVQDDLRVNAQHADRQ